MGGSKKSKFQDTTSSSPYATATSTKNGTTVRLNDFYNGLNNKVESTIPGLIDTLLNPSLDNATTKAKSDLFYNQFNKDSNLAFENNLVNPLANRNMLRSSAATNMYNQFAKDQNEKISDFNNELIANNTSDTQDLISTLMNIYLTGSNLANQAVSTAQGQSNQVNSFNVQNNAQKNSSLGNLASILGTTAGAAAMMMSDKNVKENIVPIGKLYGYNWYEFTYKENLGLPKGKQIGVIAQEVEKINPEAVKTINGIKHVDYSKLKVS